MFTRLLYSGMVHLRKPEQEVWLMPYGWLLDLNECYLQEHCGLKPYREHFIDEIIPDGI